MINKYRIGHYSVLAKRNYKDQIELFSLNNRDAQEDIIKRVLNRHSYTLDVENMIEDNISYGTIKAAKYLMKLNSDGYKYDFECMRISK
jgi:hypothetical protein